MAEENTRASLGARLREAREYRGFSQDEVAQYLALPRSAVSLMESGARRVDVLELQKLATLFDTSIEELSAEKSEPRRESASLRLLTRAVADLSPSDRSEVLRFAEFLRSKKGRKK